MPGTGAAADMEFVPPGGLSRAHERTDGVVRGDPDAVAEHGSRGQIRGAPMAVDPERGRNPGVAGPRYPVAPLGPEGDDHLGWRLRVPGT